MSAIFRIILLIVSVGTFIFIIKRIRQAKGQIEDSLFWILCALVLIILGVFPGIADFLAGVIGVFSTVNFIFLVFIFILLIREFSMTIKISQLENKIRELTQKVAIKETENENKEGEES